MKTFQLQEMAAPGQFGMVRIKTVFQVCFLRGSLPSLVYNYGASTAVQAARHPDC